MIALLSLSKKAACIDGNILAGKNGANRRFFSIIAANKPFFRPLAVPLYSFGPDKTVPVILC